MAALTKLESKLAEVLGLAMAAQDATREVRGMLGSEHKALATRLKQATDEARETQKRCTALAGTVQRQEDRHPRSGQGGQAGGHRDARGLPRPARTTRLTASSS